MRWVNYVSPRDLQELEMREGLGPAKDKDTATSLGPCLEPTVRPAQPLHPL
jgi:hypothetical protein